MFGRKAKTEAATPRRTVQRTGSAAPAFSYYTSRVSEGPTERAPERHAADAVKEQGSDRKMFSTWAFWLLLVVIIVCAGKLLLLSNNPKVTVVGQTSVSESYMQPTSVYAAAVTKIMDTNAANRSKLTADPDGIAAALKHKFPELDDVSVEIPLASNRPVVYVQPAVPSLALRTANGDYVLNKAGLTLAKLHSLPANVPVVVDQTDLAPTPGKQDLPSSTVAFVQMVAFQFSHAKLPINTFVLPANAPYELDVRLDNKPYVVRFNLQEDARVQCGAAIGTIQQLGSTNPGQYIDVRTPGRVYYK